MNQRKATGGIVRDQRAKTFVIGLTGAAAACAALGLVAGATAPGNMRLAPLAAVEPAEHTATDIVQAVDALVQQSPQPITGEGPVILSNPEIRWFNGRAMRPDRTITMRVTAYSPDARSCGDSADGLTATLHPVTTNRGKLVAADPDLLPYGSILSIPGYDEGRMVPVLDCGGAIQGSRLDVLFPTHEEALQWGVKDLEVTIWTPVDGEPLPDPRDLR